MTEADLYHYRATAHRIIDGDTFIAMIDLGFRAWYQCSCRVLDLWCPEPREPGGPEARDAAITLLEGPFLLRSERLDGFGRALVTVQLEEGDFAEVMIAAGHGTATKRVLEN